MSCGDRINDCVFQPSDPAEVVGSIVAAVRIDVVDDMTRAGLQLQRLIGDPRIICSMSRSANVPDNAAMESLFPRKDRAHGSQGLQDETRADVFDYIERFYNPRGDGTRRWATSAQPSSRSGLCYLNLMSENRQQHRLPPNGRVGVFRHLAGTDRCSCRTANGCLSVERPLPVLKHK